MKTEQRVNSRNKLDIELIAIKNWLDNLDLKDAREQFETLQAILTTIGNMNTSHQQETIIAATKDFVTFLMSATADNKDNRVDLKKIGWTELYQILIHQFDPVLINTLETITTEANTENPLTTAQAEFLKKVYDDLIALATHNRNSQVKQIIINYLADVFPSSDLRYHFIKQIIEGFRQIADSLVLDGTNPEEVQAKKALFQAMIVALTEYSQHEILDNVTNNNRQNLIQLKSLARKTAAYILAMMRREAIPKQ